MAALDVQRTSIMNSDGGKRRTWIIEQPLWCSSKSRDSSGAIMNTDVAKGKMQVAILPVQHGKNSSRQTTSWEWFGRNYSRP